MRLILAKRLSNDSGSYFILAFTSYSYTGTHGHPSLSLRQGQLHTHGTRHKTHDTPGPEHPQRSRKGEPGSENKQEGLLQSAASAQGLGSASLRGVLVTPRTLSGGRRERARGLSLSRPTPLSSPSSLRLRLRDPALLSPPQNAPSHPLARVRRGGPQGEGTREGRAYVLACVSGSAHAGVRGHGEKVALARAARLPVAM